jgi:drug/metabolite transporter (DMT)-like permease
MNLRVIVVWLLLCLIWGSTWLFIKLGLADLPPVSFVGLRFLIASVILWLIVKWRRAPLPRNKSEWWLLALTGLLSAFNYCLLFWGEQHTSSGLAAVIQTIIPAYGLVIAHYHLPTERITPVKLTGVAVGIAGVAVIFSNQLSVEGELAFQGSAAIAIGAFAAAYSNVLVKAHGGRIDPAVVAAGQLTCGLPLLLATGLAHDGNPLNFHWTLSAVICLLYLATMGSAVAFIMFYWLVRQIDVTKTMLIALVTPVIAVSLGALTLNERLTWRVAIGGVSIIAGVALIMFQTSARARKEEFKAKKSCPEPAA